MCAELHQTQLSIQRDLATLQAAVSQSNLPVEERPGQAAAMDNQEAVLANTESLLHAMEVKTKAFHRHCLCHSLLCMTSFNAVSLLYLTAVFSHHP